MKNYLYNIKLYKVNTYVKVYVSLGVGTEGLVIDKL